MSLSRKEEKIVRLERQILLFNLAIAGIHRAPESLKNTDEFLIVSNCLNSLKKDIKRRLGVKKEKDLLCNGKT